MKKFATLFVFIFLISYLSSSQTPRNVQSLDFAVMLSAEVSSQPPSIKLTWEKKELAVQYRVFRKVVKDMAFGTFAIATLDSSISEFTDMNVLVGVAYEYEVRVYSLGGLFGIPTNFIGFGYVLTGIDIPEYDQPGNVLLLIDTTMKESLSNEILRLKRDLRAEGWGIIEKYVPRTEQFDGAAVKAVKQIVLDESAKDAVNLKSIYLLGRVAVPYSGNLNPDAHPDHLGAWPADIYYGYLADHLFTDVSINNTVASRTANDNVPGDGKFDQSAIGSSLANIAVGRVDLYGMKLFHDGLSEPETELLKRYLDKNNKYRTGQFDYTVSGIIDDNFNGNDIETGFASSGWRNFGSLAGGKNVRKADFFTTLGTENHLFAYGCGGGSYTTCGGVGKTEDFVSKPVNSVFTMLFGSYFGDWDANNNFLRAPLASNPMALTCVWAGRPHWYFHHMAFGYPIGYSALITHNNYDLYKPSYATTPQYPNGIIYAAGMRGIHTALMGDPTLKLSPNSVPSPVNVIAVQPVNDEGKALVKINWDLNVASEPHHFNVYRSLSEFGLYKKLNSTPITVKEFEDELTGEEFEQFNGPIYYMVRTAMLETNNSGRYYNVSRGTISSLMATDVKDNTGKISGLKVSPNPAFDYADISIITSTNARTVVDVCDLNGNVIINLLSSNLSAGSHNINWDLRNSFKQSIPAGIYIIRVQSGSELLVQKISILK